MTHRLSRKPLSLQVRASRRTFFSEMAVVEWNFIQINSHTSSSIRDTPVQYTMSRTLGGILQGRVHTPHTRIHTNTHTSRRAHTNQLHYQFHSPLNYYDNISIQYFLLFVSVGLLFRSSSLYHF